MDSDHKQTFFKKLHKFKTERGEDIEPPSFAKRAVDQYKLWTAVHEAGGHAEVTASKGWARIGRMFDPPKTMTDLSFRIKKIYETNLLPFERAVLGGTVQGVHVPARQAQSTPVRTAKPTRAPKRASASLAGGSKRPKLDSSTDALVGKRIRVLWPEEGEFFSGTVTTFVSDTGLHKIEYDDGDEEVLDLSTQTWHMMADMVSDGEELQLLDNGGLGQLHSAAEALAKSGRRTGGDGWETDGTPVRLQDMPETGCIISNDDYKVVKSEDPAGYEIFCLIPGFQLEEIRVQCWPKGKMLVSCTPQDEGSSAAWTRRAVKYKIRLPGPVHPPSARALLTLHGQLYIQVHFPPARPDADEGQSTERQQQPNDTAEQLQDAVQAGTEPSDRDRSPEAGPAVVEDPAAAVQAGSMVQGQAGLDAQTVSEGVQAEPLEISPVTGGGSGTQAGKLEGSEGQPDGIAEGQTVGVQESQGLFGATAD